MKRRKFSVHQIIRDLKAVEAGPDDKGRVSRAGDQRRHLLPLEVEVRWDASVRDQALA
jgi:hypothetical protein